MVEFREQPYEHDNDNRFNVCDFPAERLVRGCDDRASQAGAPGQRAGGDAEGVQADLAAEKRNFLIWSSEAGKWWGPGFDGYTPLISRAGRYKLDEATIICSNNNCYCRPTDEPAAVMMLAPEELPPPLADANRPGLTEDLATG